MTNRVNTGKFILLMPWLPANGHIFGDDMICRCGVSFLEHQAKGLVCQEKAKNDKIRKVKKP